jgi:long-chain acyl-CoA synthetase
MEVVTGYPEYKPDYGEVGGYQNIPDMFFQQARKYGSRVKEKVKREGLWIDLSWEEVAHRVRKLASGLLELEVGAGDKIAILSTTRAEWVHADLAVLSLGAITIPIYPTNTAEQVEYILADSGALACFVEDAAQLEKVLPRKAELPHLKHLILFEGEGGQKEQGVLTLEELQKIGEDCLDRNLAEIEQRIAGLKLDDIATIVYTSGTTGEPKGVVQTHGNHLAMISRLYKVLEQDEKDLNLLWLPLAHSFARCVEFFVIYAGEPVAYAESMEKIVTNMQETSPTNMASVPRFYEKAYSTIMSRAEESPLKRRIFHWAMRTGREVSRKVRRKEPLPLSLKVKRAVAEKLVFSKLKKTLGGKLRYFITGGAPISVEILEFFHSAGILILEGYGLTETCPATHINRLNNFKFGTVGLPIPGVETRIAADGEILVRGPNIAYKGYWKKPEETREAFTTDGWFKTGDIGYIDEEGFLSITDRKKELIVTAGGKNIAPSPIENALKADPFISQAMVYGDRKPYCVALLTINLEEAEKFARENSIDYHNLAELCKHPKVRERVQQTVDEINARLSRVEAVKKFEIIPAEWTQESGELTPTLKVKRRVINQRYADIIERMYQEG